jgi:uncharacterized membrane protein
MSRARYDSIDALRGIAIVWMTLFHFCFDLNHFGWLHQNFYHDPFWTWQRTAIVSLFLFCAGLGQAVAGEQGQGWARFWKRWAQVAGCAVLVTMGSWWMFPKSFIYFGVLHGIALMLIVVRLTSGWGGWLWLAGALALLLQPLAELAHGQWPALVFLNQPPWNVLGLVSRKPVTEDYVPLIPWLGVMWWGVAAGRLLLSRHRDRVRRPLRGRIAAALTWLGRWSLSWYMVHQPVLIGAVAAVSFLARR